MTITTSERVAMVKRISLALALLAFVGCVTPVRAAGWESVFSDEFDGSALDRNKWATRYIYNNETQDKFNDEKQRYKDIHQLSNGSLNLIARKANNGLFDSSMIRTYQTFYYGYYEARVFLPAGKGIWPAFWLVGDYDQDGEVWYPPEIDIFEYVINGKDDKDTMLHSSAVDTFANDPSVYTYVDRSFRLKHQEMYADTPLNTGWHTAALVWTPDQITMLWDGRRVYTREYKWLRKDGQLGPPAHVILNFAVGGRWPERYGLDEAAFPQAFKIDYVHICRYTASSEGSRLCAGGTATPDPAQFAYSTPMDDLPKAEFLAVNFGARRGMNDGVLEMAVNEGLTGLHVPFRVPSGVPTDRSLRLEIVDEAQGKVLATRTFSEAELSTDDRDKALHHADYDVPALPGGRYLVRASLITPQAADDPRRGKKRTPITCKTGISQPIKGLVCTLAKILVDAPKGG